jgi:hypothetical protein
MYYTSKRLHGLEEAVTGLGVTPTPTYRPGQAMPVYNPATQSMTTQIVQDQGAINAQLAQQQSARAAQYEASVQAARNQPSSVAHYGSGGGGGGGAVSVNAPVANILSLTPSSGGNPSVLYAGPGSGRAPAGQVPAGAPGQPPPGNLPGGGGGGAPPGGVAPGGGGAAPGIGGKQLNAAQQQALQQLQQQMNPNNPNNLPASPLMPIGPDADPGSMPGGAFGPGFGPTSTSSDAVSSGVADSGGGGDGGGTAGFGDLAGPGLPVLVAAAFVLWLIVKKR